MESTARWTSHPRLWVTAWLLVGVTAALGLPAAAQAHGPVDPAASSYQARVAATLVGTLIYGFVLLALPAFPARLVVAACLAGGVGLLPVVFALAERPQGRRRVVDPVPDSLEPSL